MTSPTDSMGEGKCPTPFLEAELYPASDGYMKGRFCSNMQGTSCCLPCPHSNWLYPDHFNFLIEKASWINLPGLLCSIFLIASFIVLPVSKTRRHYLSLCLVTSIAMMNVAFLIPHGTKPAQCKDAITPHDMNSSTTCAISGALVIAGGWFGVMWVCLITLALHLQICWHMVVGNIFMWGAITAGCIIPTFGVVIALTLSGVSFRFGNTCHVNAENSLLSLWIPLMVVASFTLCMQLATFTYCLRVYFVSLGNEIPVTNSSSNKSTHKKSGNLTPKQAYFRVQKVILLQWRGILIVLIIVADVIFFAVFFVSLNGIESNLSNSNGHETVMPWLNCLVQTRGDKEACFTGTKIPRVSEGTIMSVLVLLSLNGFWCLILLGRFSMLTGWLELITGRKDNEAEFVSTDVHQPKNPANYEMIANTSDDAKPPNSIGTPSKATFCSSPDRFELPIQGYIWSSPMVGYQNHDKCPV